MAEPLYLYGMRVRNYERNMLTPFQRQFLINKANLPLRYAYGYSDKDLVSMVASVQRKTLRPIISQALYKNDGKEVEKTLQNGSTIKVTFTRAADKEIRSKLLLLHHFMPLTVLELGQLDKILKDATHIGGADNTKVDENGERRGSSLKKTIKRFEYFMAKSADGYDVFFDVGITENGKCIVYSIQNSMPLALKNTE